MLWPRIDDLHRSAYSKRLRVFPERGGGEGLSEGTPLDTQLLHERPFSERIREVIARRASIVKWAIDARL